MASLNHVIPINHLVCSTLSWSRSKMGWMKPFAQAYIPTAYAIGDLQVKEAPTHRPQETWAFLSTFISSYFIIALYFKCPFLPFIDNLHHHDSKGCSFTGCTKPRLMRPQAFAYKESRLGDILVRTHSISGFCSLQCFSIGDIRLKGASTCHSLYTETCKEKWEAFRDFRVRWCFSE